MDELLALFKSNPLEAVGIIVVSGLGYLWKSRAEKKEAVESRGVDAREIERLNKEVERRDKVIEGVSKERDDANDRADAAFAKQLELTERFSEMRAQNERVLARMDQLSDQMKAVLDENGALREQVAKLTTELNDLRSSLQTGSHL